jgi:hypothetical protein
MRKVQRASHWLQSELTEPWRKQSRPQAMLNGEQRLIKVKIVVVRARTMKVTMVAMTRGLK